VYCWTGRVVDCLYQCTVELIVVSGHTLCIEKEDATLVDVEATVALDALVVGHRCRRLQKMWPSFDVWTCECHLMLKMWLSLDDETQLCLLCVRREGHARSFWTRTSIERKCHIWTRVSLRLGRDSRCITLPPFFIGIKSDNSAFWIMYVFLFMRKLG